VRNFIAHLDTVGFINGTGAVGVCMLIGME